jgi:hypothetical protein
MTWCSSTGRGPAGEILTACGQQRRLGVREVTAIRPHNIPALQAWRQQRATALLNWLQTRPHGMVIAGAYRSRTIWDGGVDRCKEPSR